MADRQPVAHIPPSVRSATLTFNDLRATQSGNDLLLTIRGTDQGMTLKDYYATPQDWTVQDGSGAQQSAANDPMPLAA